jgi:hypothetical protein
MRRALRFPLDAGQRFGRWRVIGGVVFLAKGGKDRPHYRYVSLAQAELEAQHRQYSPADRLKKR